MRKIILFIFLLITGLTSNLYSQGRSTRIGYIDMEYILENVPAYKETETQLEQKAQKWKLDIEAKKKEIDKIKENLKAEKTLLTKELIEERESEIKFLENEMLDYQQKRFGPNGDLVIQKTALIKPIQDQVFTAVQDIAETKKYDFIFDKSSNLTMLFSAKRYDISDLVLRVVNRAGKREQLTKKQLAAEEAKDKREEEIADNPELLTRKRTLEERKAAREQLSADKKAAIEQQKKEYDERNKKLKAERQAKKSGTVSDITIKDSIKPATTPEEIRKERAAINAAKLKERQKILDEKKKKLEEEKLKQ